MKKVQITKTAHNCLNENLENVLRYCESNEIYFVYKLEDRLKERGMSLRECSSLTGLRLETLSNLMNGKKSTLNIHHILILMVALRITDMSELFEVVFPEPIKEQLDNEQVEWVQEGQAPSQINIF